MLVNLAIWFAGALAYVIAAGVLWFVLTRPRHRPRLRVVRGGVR